MEHSFNVDIAKEYGIEEAIFIHNMYFWIKKNAANNVHLYDGRRWTYNSAKAYAELFPYMNENKIYRVIKSLTSYDIIVKGNYNDNKYLQTSWYAFTDKGLEVLKQCGYDIYKLSESNPEKEKIHFTKIQNGSNENVECITYNNTDNKEISTNVDTKKDETSSCSPELEKFNLWMTKNAPYCATHMKQLTEDELKKLKKEYEPKQISYIIEQIENRKDLRKRYTNLYRTVLNWAKKEYGNKGTTKA